MALERTSRFLKGRAEFHSPFFSRTWTLRQDGAEIASATKARWRRTARITLDDGAIWEIRPVRWGILEIRSGDELLAKAERVNWLGREWALTSRTFGYVLRSRSMTLRRWTIDLGDHPVVTLQGGRLTFNRLQIDAPGGVPLEAVMLSWHIIVRAWEAAATAAAGA